MESVICNRDRDGCGSTTYWILIEERKDDDMVKIICSESKINSRKREERNLMEVFNFQG